MADYSAWHNKTYDLAADDLIKLCVNTIENMKKGQMTKADLHMGRLEATIGYGGFMLPGKDPYAVVIDITPKDASTSQLSLEVFIVNNYGKKIPFGIGANTLRQKSEQRRNEFVTELENRISRFQLKYG